MPEANSLFTNFSGGMSQLDPHIRPLTHCELQRNAMVSPIEGMTKRAGSKFVTKFAEDGAIKKVERLSLRDDNYLVLYTSDNSNPIRIFDEAGEEFFVEYDDQTTKDYLTISNSAADRMSITRIQDTVFLTSNKDTVTKFEFGDSQRIPYFEELATVEITRGVVGQEYKVIVRENTGTTGVGSYTPQTEQEASTLNIAEEIAASLRTQGLSASITTRAQVSGSDVALSETSVIRIDTRASGDFLIGTTVYPNRRSDLIKVAYKNVQLFNDLPSKSTFQLGSPNRGHIVKVEGENAEAGGLYVEYDGIEEVWKETKSPNADAADFDSQDMPRLMFKLQGTEGVEIPAGQGFNPTQYFSIAKSDAWKSRPVGDNLSAPAPSFTGSEIVDSAFLAGRLFFITESAIIGSRADDPFNFWPVSVAEVLPIDPIDIRANTQDVFEISKITKFRNKLILYSKSKGQLQFHSGNSPMTPTTAVIEPLSDFETPEIVGRPLSLGFSTYVIEKNNAFSSLLEFFKFPVEGFEETAKDVTEHVPKLLPGDVNYVLGSTQANMVLVNGRTPPGSLETGFDPVITNTGNLLVFQYLKRGNEQVQAAWGIWDMPGGDVNGQEVAVQGAAVIGKTLYLIQKTKGSVVPANYVISKLDLDNLFEITSPVNFPVTLDWKVSLEGTYNSSTDETTFVIPYFVSNANEQLKALDKFGLELEFKSIDGDLGADTTTVVVDGEVPQKDPLTDTTRAVFGLKYDHVYEFSRFTVRPGGGTVGIMQDVTTIEELLLKVENTARFDVVIDPGKGRQTITKPFNATFQNSTKVGGQAQFFSGIWRTAIGGRAGDVKITLVNDSPYPSKFTLASIGYSSFTRGEAR